MFDLVSIIYLTDFFLSEKLISVENKKTDNLKCIDL